MRQLHGKESLAWIRVGEKTKVSQPSEKGPLLCCSHDIVAADEKHDFPQGEPHLDGTP